ncbi:hypothetical protein [Helicobacter typhlonius]|jgi:hypothetical protein|uniref:hypothetical protein n=1 Tax=Helicobacter typhlonius TaxID=76936 RepID=UPI002FE31407
MDTNSDLLNCLYKDMIAYFTGEPKRIQRLNGKQIGLPKGTKLVTKKSIQAKEQILKYNKSFNGSLNNEDTWKLIGISKTTFYKYKEEMLTEALP